jgi:ABC-type lipoprotein release transport system permease subunit
MFLDLVLLAIALYGFAVLNRQGPVSTGAATAAVAQDPLIAVAPLLFAVAISLLIGRILPWLAAGGVRVLAGCSSPPVHVALQSVARAPRQPMRLVQLCTLTLTLGIFAATVAGVQARNQADQQAYEAGATVRLQEFVDRSHGLGKDLQDAMPLADHLALPGVHAATPALRYESFGNVTNSTSDGTNVNVLGVDPRTARRVMWFRPDFAEQPFSRLLALIATPGPNAIVSDTFLRATGLHRGDSFTVTLTNNQTINARIAGTAHYFPTLDPTTLPFVITNLTYLQRVSHGHGPNEVWMATDTNPATIDRLVQTARRWPRLIIAYEAIAPATDAGIDPLKVGIYGVVSVGFLIAVTLALLGFLAYAYVSLQQRLTEFAILRALGLSAGEMRALLLYEQVFLLGAAMLGGVAAGLLTTQLFLPYLPIATHTLPPFLVLMPWGAVVAFVLAMLAVFLLVLSAHITLVLRLPLGRVLRLGDA